MHHHWWVWFFTSPTALWEWHAGHLGNLERDLNCFCASTDGAVANSNRKNGAYNLPLLSFSFYCSSKQRPPVTIDDRRGDYGRVASHVIEQVGREAGCHTASKGDAESVLWQGIPDHSRCRDCQVTHCCIPRATSTFTKSPCGNFLQSVHQPGVMKCTVGGQQLLQSMHCSESKACVIQVHIYWSMLWPHVVAASDFSRVIFSTSSEVERVLSTASRRVSGVTCKKHCINTYSYICGYKQHVCTYIKTHVLCVHHCM